MGITGMPVGIDWQDFVRYGVVEYPDVHVYSYRTKRQKRQDLYSLEEKGFNIQLDFIWEMLAPYHYRKDKHVRVRWCP
ncbi:hypothetical protein [Halogeometricum borinquense]|nr:hypothetical protein [Halogeometricum borinquense]